MNGVAGLDKEIAELKDFIADLKAECAAQKEKEKRPPWVPFAWPARNPVVVPLPRSGGGRHRKDVVRLAELARTSN